ncbi:protein-tyrosine phosphatase family protein [Rhodoflexus caldus]|uniref:protein-tyrosine phosphatase family protein n=1 Tax=Rhodoflexus caldus TaxID=2891236 RepID=UPI00202A999B|nr:tyrosine-protein phosphatase [Rhodoflexus caldus]
MIILKNITDYINRVEKLNEIDINELNLFIQQVDDLIKENKENGKIYGSFRGQLLRIKKSLQDKNSLIIKKQERYSSPNKQSQWVAISKGFLKIGHKPGGKKLSFKQLFHEGTTTIFTILSEREGALQIQKNCEELGIKWLWLPLPNGDIPNEILIPEIIYKFKIVKALLENQEKIYLHCSAGLHRTGMITNGLLRFLGYDETESYQIINQLRPITAKEVGKIRLDFGKQFYDLTIN